jgi:hypothetical protein
MGHLIRREKQTGPRAPTSASLDAEFGLRWFLCLARARPRLPTPPRVPRAATPPIVAHVRDGSTNASERLPPHPSRALTLINATRNHDVTQHRDADTPRKQAFTHTTTLLQQLRYVQPLPWGLGRTVNPSAYASTLSRKSTGNQRASQQCIASSYQSQDAKTSPLGIRRPPASQHTSPRCINRAVWFLQRSSKHKGEHSVVSQCVLGYWHLPQSVPGTWWLPFSRCICNLNCRHSGASNINIIPSAGSGALYCLN